MSPGICQNTNATAVPMTYRLRNLDFGHRYNTPTQRMQYTTTNTSDTKFTQSRTLKNRTYWGKKVSITVNALKKRGSGPCGGQGTQQGGRQKDWASKPVRVPGPSEIGSRGAAHSWDERIVVLGEAVLEADVFNAILRRRTTRLLEINFSGAEMNVAPIRRREILNLKTRLTMLTNWLQRQKLF